ncbi:hypothetical protein J3F83DRAFT_272631 [Trichoderma novae-zelandiae]
MRPFARQCLLLRLSLASPPRSGPAALVGGCSWGESSSSNMKRLTFGFLSSPSHVTLMLMLLFCWSSVRATRRLSRSNKTATQDDKNKPAIVTPSSHLYGILYRV